MRFILVALEDFDIIKHLLVYRDLVVVSDRVLVGKVKDDVIRLFKCNVFATQ